jgi:hypothetical protein
MSSSDVVTFGLPAVLQNLLFAGVMITKVRSTAIEQITYRMSMQHVPECMQHWTVLENLFFVRG